MYFSQSIHGLYLIQQISCIIHVLSKLPILIIRSWCIIEIFVFYFNYLTRSPGDKWFKMNCLRWIVRVCQIDVLTSHTCVQMVLYFMYFVIFMFYILFRKITHSAKFVIIWLMISVVKNKPVKKWKKVLCFLS